MPCALRRSEIRPIAQIIVLCNYTSLDTMTTMKRREYAVRLSINGRKIEKVIIDLHFEIKHRASIDDQVILELVKLLDGERFEPEKRLGSYEYFARDSMFLNGKFYKLVWLLEDNALYIGVINAYRRK
jgi:hypothetical protein